MQQRFPSEFKRGVVTVARRGDPTLAEVIADFNVFAESVRRWLHQADINDGVHDGFTSSQLSEIVQLRRDKRCSKMQNEILRRGAAYLAKDALPR